VRQEAVPLDNAKLASIMRIPLEKGSGYKGTQKVALFSRNVVRRAALFIR
jgi:hypothetical protein